MAGCVVPRVVSSVGEHSEVFMGVALDKFSVVVASSDSWGVERFLATADGRRKRVNVFPIFSPVSQFKFIRSNLSCHIPTAFIWADCHVRRWRWDGGAMTAGGDGCRVRDHCSELTFPYF